MKTILILLMCTLICVGCKKTDIPKDTPTCVADYINNVLKSSNACNDSNVNSYLFQGQTIYIIYEGSCIADGTSPVFSEDCDILGYLGGIAGNNTINGENIANAVFIRKVWSR